jgi:hypothetical protein
VTITWNPWRFHVIETLAKDRICNAEYYRDNILTARMALLPEAGGRQLVIHPDHARTHAVQKCRTFCAENGLQLVAYPPYSPDLGVSNFFLFGYIKNCPQGVAFPSHAE